MAGTSAAGVETFYFCKWSFGIGIIRNFLVYDVLVDEGGIGNIAVISAVLEVEIGESVKLFIIRYVYIQYYEVKIIFGTEKIVRCVKCRNIKAIVI